MSIQEAPQSAPSEASQTTGNAGSPPVRDGEQSGHEAAPEAQASGDDDGALPSSVESENAAQQYEEMKERYESLVRDLASNPAVMAAINGVSPGGDAQAQMSPTARALAEVFGGDDDDSKAWRKGMGKIAESMREEILGEVRAMLGNELGSVKQTMAKTEFERSVVSNGVPAKDLAAPEFQKHLKALRADPAFRTLESKRPGSAAKWAAAEWNARAMARQQNMANRERVDMAKGSKLNGSAPRGTATSTGKVDFDPRDPSSLSRISAHLKSGGSLSDIVRKPLL